MSRAVDPQLDPLRAPSERGLHPHTTGDDRAHNPQQMYEQREGYGQRKAVGEYTPQNGQKAPGFLENPFLLIGIGAVVAYGLSRLFGSDRDDDDDEEEDEVPRKQRAAPPVQVVAAPALPAPAPAPPPVIVMSALPAPAPITNGADVKRRRVRRTTQARSGGRYEKAGTRKRAHVEGTT